MNLLLDTHLVLWAMGAPEKIPPGMREQIASERNQVWVSAISVHEIAIKAGLGKLAAPADLSPIFEALLFQEMPFDWRHAEAVRALPIHHRDPFDRALVAQSRIEGIPLMTVDEALRPYSSAATLIFSDA